MLNREGRDLNFAHHWWLTLKECALRDVKDRPQLSRVLIILLNVFPVFYGRMISTAVRTWTSLCNGIVSLNSICSNDVSVNGIRIQASVHVFQVNERISLIWHGSWTFRSMLSSSKSRLKLWCTVWVSVSIMRETSKGTAKGSGKSSSRRLLI